MGRQRHMVEQIINMLRQVEVLFAQDRSVTEVAEEWYKYSEQVKFKYHTILKILLKGILILKKRSQLEIIYTMQYP